MNDNRNWNFRAQYPDLGTDPIPVLSLIHI